MPFRHQHQKNPNRSMSFQEKKKKANYSIRYIQKKVNTSILPPVIKILCVRQDSVKPKIKNYERQ